jgi:glycosyltransferase involved in cell wall biosynthesis
VRVGISALAASNTAGLGRLARTYLLALAAAVPDWELHAYFRSPADLKLLVEECDLRHREMLDVLVPHFLSTPIGGRLAAEEWDIPRQFGPLGLDAYLGLDFTLPSRPVAAREYAVLPDMLPITRPGTLSWRARWLYRRAIDRAIERKAGLICISRQTEQRFQEFAGGSGCPTYVVYPALSPRLEQYAATDPPDLTRLQVLGSLNQTGVLRSYILSVGVAGRRKNTALLVDIHREIVLQGDYAGSLVLVGGDGSFHSAPLTGDFAWQAVGALVNQGSRAAAVYDLGRVTDYELSLLYRGADLYVSFSAEEGFGYPVLEALTYGTPALVAAGSSMTEIATGGIATTELERERCRQTLVSTLGALPILRREVQAFDYTRFGLENVGRQLAAALSSTTVEQK